MRAIQRELQRTVEASVEDIVQQAEAAARARIQEEAARVAVTVSAWADIRRMEDRIVIEVRLPKETNP